MSVRSATGHQLERAELFAYDGDGNRIKPRPIPAKPTEDEAEVIPVHETRSTPNSTHGLEDKQELSRALDRLSPEEWAVMALQEESEWRLTVEQWTPEEVEAKRDDKHVLAIGRLDKGFHEVTVRRRFNLTYERMAERLGISARQVHRRVATANRKMRGG